jgi:hypothetical protein
MVWRYSGDKELLETNHSPTPSFLVPTRRSAMAEQISLEQAEKRAFRIKHDDGLWDIFAGCFFLLFVSALFVSARLGDFWTSAALLVSLWLTLWGVRLVRKHVVVPRVGVVKFGRARKAKLRKFTLVMLAVNILALILGIFAATQFEKLSGQMIAIIFGLILLVGFSLAGYFLDFGRPYIYGLLLGLSPPVGEWLYSKELATHHGFPVTFGTSATIMILVGLAVFARLLRDNPIPLEETPAKEA